MSAGLSRARLWFEGARPRTLGASIVPVIVGTAAAEHATPLRTLGCFVVALGMQVGVNYANDYSDGTRGVDTVHGAITPATGDRDHHHARRLGLSRPDVDGFAGGMAQQKLLESNC